MKREHYVYIYLNPLKEGNYVYGKFKFDYEPFYVGLGKNKRIHEHIFDAKINERKTFKDNIILKILKNELDPIRFKLYEDITLESAKRLEIYLIKLIGRRDLGKGTLVNLTDGGDGSHGYILTEENREKLRVRTLEFWKNGVYENRDLFGEKNGFYNKEHTDETKDKIRKTIGDSRKGELNANFNNKWSDEFKEEASIRQKENHKHLTGENNPANREDVKKIISEGKMGLLNPNAKKWLLINPEKQEFVIEGGIKRNLELHGLFYQHFSKRQDGIRYNTKGWILKEI